MQWLDSELCWQFMDGNVIMNIKMCQADAAPYETWCDILFFKVEG
jgi:hypothetical protein